MPPKKGKKGKEPEPEPEVIEELPPEEPEPEPEEVQFTDTSYTSASFESLPPMPVVDEKKAKKKKKKIDDKESTLGKKASSVLTVFSEDSIAPPAPSVIDFGGAVPAPVEVVEEPKKAKGKKGKKGKKEDLDLPEFEKPKNWKKMNKKEREIWMTERIEEWKAEMEAEKQRILAGAKEKRLAAARERDGQMARDVNEQDIRKDILVKTVTLFNKSERQKVNQLNQKQEEEEWAQYLRCDGLPDPRVVTQMNTFLHLWENKGLCNAEDLDVKCREVLPMLSLLEELVTRTKQFSPQQVANYNDVRINLRKQLATTIEMASFSLLRDLEKNLKFESTKIATFERNFTSLKLNLWVAIKWPTTLIRPSEASREPVELEYPSLKVKVVLPKIIDTSSGVCVRAARSLVDLLSENTRSFKVPPLPNKEMDLMVFNEEELKFMINTKNEQDDYRKNFFKEIGVKIRELEIFLKQNPYTKNEKEKEALDNLNMQEPGFMPDPRTLRGEQNDKLFRNYLKSCLCRARPGEVNMRKYRIVGGVLNMDLIVTPPQPKRMAYNVILSTFLLPKTLKAKKYQIQYRTPPPPEPGVIRTPEEIEAENKRIELAYQKLAQIYIELPHEVMWLEPPIVCQWNENRLIWTSNYVNDYKYNEEKLTVQFRTGVLWPIGIATLKYANLPFQGWEVKPDRHTKGVLVIVTGVFLTCTWLCVGNFVKLKFIANATTSALKEHYNKPYSVKKMVQLMREAGCDFFPEFDCHNHIEGTCAKEWAMESHLYHAMAYLSRAYNFQWSRWNTTTGSRVIVIQFREAVDLKREGKLCLLYVTPQRCTILKCHEMSPEFNDEPIKNFPFYPDLFTLNLSYGSVDARRTTFGMKFRLVETVYELLQELMPCSVS